MSTRPKIISNEPVLAHLREHLPVAQRGEDPRGVHQVRVATRRLGVWLVLGGHRVLLDDLRWLRASAASVRDLDVLCATDLPGAWHDWLAERRAHAREALVEALGSSRLAGLVRALGFMPPIDHAGARRRTRGLAETARRLGRAVDRGATLDEVHALRRSLRRLRYAREWLGGQVTPLVAAQDALGALNDASVALRLLDAYGGEGMEGVRAALLERVEAGRHQAVETWAALRDELTRED